MDRLIIDSSTWVDPAASFAMIEETSQANPELVIQDHAWTRSWQFRVGIAGLFDDGVAQAALPKVERVEVVCHPAHRNSALQVLAWLAVQANWADHPGEGLGFVSPKGTPIAITLKDDANGPALSAVRLIAGTTEVSVTQAAGASHVERQVKMDAYRASSLSPADPATPAELVGVQLARGGKNSLYQKILPRFRELLKRR